MPEWLRNEAISNYVVFFAGVICTIIGWLFIRMISRKRPSIIRVEKIYENSLIDIDPKIRNKLKITYEDQPIDEFYTASFFIHNMGEVPIEDIELIFAIEDLSSIDFLEITYTNKERKEEFTVINPSNIPSDDPTVSQKPTEDDSKHLEYDPIALDPDVFAIQLPFLNPYKTYEDYLGLTIYAPKQILIKGIVGKGVGWTTQYIDKTISIDKFVKILERGAVPFADLFLKILLLRGK